MLHPRRRPAVTTAAKPIFTLRELCRRYSGNGTDFELWVPSLTVNAGELVVLKGASGSGKSTLLDILALISHPDRVTDFRFVPGPGPGIDVARLWSEGRLDSLSRLRGEHIGYILQVGGLLPFLTVRENIGLPCRLLGRSSVRTVLELTERLDISRQLDKFPAQLSVGERQRVAIARALAHRPNVVLADEPTASVDPLNATAILQLLLDLVERSGITTIIASHDWQGMAGLRTLEFRLEREGSLSRATVGN
ncbi:MAG: ABC transporter ATP-binding protein [Candidatus Competibacteraceae bacterium]